MATLRKAVPPALQRAGRRFSRELGRRTASHRVQPDMILVGGQRCGTTSLFRALMDHPQVLRPNLHKGVNYFDLNYHHGPDWYTGHFPLAATARMRVPNGTRPLVFEASGYYLYHPFAVERIAADLPDVKLVAMLRDPVERAYSAWKHERARGYEWEEFEDALALEDERLAGEFDRMSNETGYESFSHRHHSYRHRGDYFGQLQRIAKEHGRDKLHVVYSEDFFAQPAEEFARLTDFLELPGAKGVTFGHYNARPSTSMPVAAREQLTAHYAAERTALEDLVGRPAPWPRYTGAIAPWPSSLQS